MSKTIVAISTALGKGAISVIRMSGEEAFSIAHKLFIAKNNATVFEHSKMYLGTVKTEHFCDQCFCVCFFAPNSYTGENLVEFQCHGGVKLAQCVVKECVSCGAVLADKGEFTRRAFLNGKLSLADAEGIIDMINAESTAQLNAGFRLLNGKFSTHIRCIIQQLVDTTAQLEASLDYPDEMEDEAMLNCKVTLDKIDVELANLLATAKNGMLIKNGISVAIIGVPNIGKSSLLNALIARDRAIVTDIAGTTRDSIEESLEVDGVLLNFVDTAGIRNSCDTIEQLGVIRSKEIAKNADLILMLLNANAQMSAEEQLLINSYQNKPMLFVYNKSDLGIAKKDTSENAIYISAKYNKNIDLLKQKIVDICLDKSLENDEMLTSLRHIQAIQKAKSSIENAKSNLKICPIECTLVDLKDSYFALGEITGDTANENIIDAVFTKFCLGK
ncbi:MAG: tRNA uridine-5-carboxymethylaminomethyl(34) synthesis GTPase MnmE [Clostridia bacterium]